MITNSLTTSGNWLTEATKKLKTSGIDSARIDGLLMLEDCLEATRTDILSNPNYRLTKAQLKSLNTYLNRRLSYEPMAYIRNGVEFYGRAFFVDRSVLIPRPETESFIELLSQLNPVDIGRAADIGGGSGCIGISAKLEFPNLSVDLLDISPSAIKVAQKNAKLLKAEVKTIKGDLLAGSDKPYDIILANLPYVPKAYKFDQSTSYEPKLALIGGDRGLEIYKKLWEQIKHLKKPPKFVMTESLRFQHQDMEAIANSSGYYLDKTNGLVQLFKLSIA